MGGNLSLIPENRRDAVFYELSDEEWSELSALSGLREEDRAFLNDLTVNYRVDLLTKQKKRGTREWKADAKHRAELQRLRKAISGLAESLGDGIDLPGRGEGSLAVGWFGSGELSLDCDPLARQLWNFEERLSMLIQQQASLKRTDARILRWIIRALHRLLLVRSGRRLTTAKSDRSRDCIDPFRFAQKFFTFAERPIVAHTISIDTVRNAINNHLRGYKVSIEDAKEELDDDREAASDNQKSYRLALSRRRGGID